MGFFIQQSTYLHNTMAMLVVKMGNYQQHVENKGKAKIEICMNVKGTDGMYLFDSTEPGIQNWCNFLYPKHLWEEVDTFLDSIFNHQLQGYVANYCRILWGG